MIERITSDTPTAERLGHEFRYRLARGWVREPWIVVDFGCGSGYGAELLQPCQYIGVDHLDVVEDRYRDAGLWKIADLGLWVPDFPFDVAVCFETIEHVANPPYLIDILCMARRTAICSTPIVPTCGDNPWHLHDFTIFDIPNLFKDRGWHLDQLVLQPSELSAVYVFGR